MKGKQREELNKYNDKNMLELVFWCQRYMLVHYYMEFHFHFSKCVY